MGDTADWAQWEKEWLEVEKTLAELQVCSVLPPLCLRQATLYCMFAHKLYLYSIFIFLFFDSRPPHTFFMPFRTWPKQAENTSHRQLVNKVHSEQGKV